jgi:hypothetical protein
MSYYLIERANKMKKFIVESHCWKQRIPIDEKIFEKKGDMAFEAMTRAVENITRNGDRWRHFKDVWEEAILEDDEAEVDDYTAYIDKYMDAFSEDFLAQPMYFGEYILSYESGTEEDDLENRVMALSSDVLVNAGCPTLAKEHEVYYKNKHKDD